MANKRVKDWAATATSLTAGKFIPVSGTPIDEKIPVENVFALLGMSADARTRNTKTDAELQELLAILPQITDASTWDEFVSGKPVVYVVLDSGDLQIVDSVKANIQVVNISTGSVGISDVLNSHTVAVKPGETVNFDTVDAGGGEFSFTVNYREALCPDATTTAAGKVELATDAEVQAGTGSLAVVVSSLAAWWTWVKTQAITLTGLLTVGPYKETVVAIGTLTSSHTLDISVGTFQTAILTASTACTFTMPTATAGKSFVLLLKQAAATGLGTAVFTGVKWETAVAPTMTATAGKMDIFSFISDGTNWYGSVTQGYTP